MQMIIMMIVAESRPTTTPMMTAVKDTEVGSRYERET